MTQVNACVYVHVILSLISIRGIGAGGASAPPLLYTRGALHPHYSSFKFQISLLTVGFLLINGEKQPLWLVLIYLHLCHELLLMKLLYSCPKSFN